MAAPRREGEFIGVYNLEDVRSAIIGEKSLAARSAAADRFGDSTFLEPVEADEAFAAELRSRDLGDEIRRVTARRLEEQWCTSGEGKPGSRDRTYGNVPNVEAFAIDRNELARLAAASCGLRAEVTAAMPVGLWHYAKCDTTCVFCYEQLMGPCHKCLSDETPAAECKIAIGECGHPVHIDCQNAWSGKNNCMTCQQSWRVMTEYSVYGGDLSI